ncbi:phospholipase [Acinetobacter qingfengensis]|uniref:phospholipase D n=1 Tax=Acinetobacter qingfengensis TaxID=1262585 RepID=A0A1E7QXP8_9GAMM|nr:phospholipase D-like domain-containing protein [Acinetobacter qingfengensis]KAA8731717.1 phospholipase [Acinetobacter qingfengensis]OEY91829.1 phospholipase [Acinetobacter qingfengensis]
MQLFRRIHQKLNWPIRRYFALIGGILFLTYLGSAVYQVYKPLPSGLDIKSPPRSSDVEFLSDLTYQDAQGKQHSEQQIFDAMLTLIEQAQNTIVLDMFLFNNETGSSTIRHRALTQELTQALIDKRQLNPNIDIQLITDPINTVYGGTDPEHLRRLKAAGINVIYTDLTVLRASNPAWSGFWYMCCQNLGNSSTGGWLPNPFGDEKVTLRSYFQLLNFKANHRKTLVVDTLDGWKALVSSANPHDGSSLHSNVAMILHDKSAIDVLDSERAVAQFSQGDAPMVILPEPKANPALPKVQILTEKAIYEEVLAQINQLKRNEQLDLMMFYLSDRDIVKAIVAARQRGVVVRVVLDPNKDAFGRQKNGIPNRQVAWELHRQGVPVRWCATNGEQCHSKLLILGKQTGEKQIILGSANYTARNLNNYNLETNVSVQAQNNYTAVVQAQQYFETVWRNPDHEKITVDYAQYKDESSTKYWLYRFMEWSGLSTF